MFCDVFYLKEKVKKTVNELFTSVSSYKHQGCLIFSSNLTKMKEIESKCEWFNVELQ